MQTTQQPTRPDASVRRSGRINTTCKDCQVNRYETLRRVLPVGDLVSCKPNQPAFVVTGTEYITPAERLMTERFRSAAPSWDDDLVRVDCERCHCPDIVDRDSIHDRIGVCRDCCRKSDRSRQERRFGEW